MSAPGDGPLSGARFGVDGPSFFRPQRKYGPVVAPKPKLNPYRPGGGPGASEASTRPEPGPAVSEACTRPEPGPAVSEACTRPEPTLNEAYSRPEPIVIEAYSRPEPGPKVTAVTDRGINRACLGRVGDIPELDLPPPPPPPQEMEDVPPAAAFAPPPPPPPPPFEESFPPPPEDASFPSPPSPLAQDVPQEGGGGSSLELEIDNLSSLIKDMEKGGPQSAKITTSGPRVLAEAGVSSEQARPPPPAQTGPRPAGFAPVKAPKPSVPPSRGRAWPPADPSPKPGPQRAAAGPVSTATKPGPCAAGPVSTATKPGPQWAAAGPVSTATKPGPCAAGPVSTATRPGPQQAAAGPVSAATKPGPRAAGPGLVGQASQAEAPGRRGEEGIQTGTTVSVGVLSPPSRAAAPLPAPLSHRDVGRASPAEAPGRRGEEGTQTGTTMSVGVLSPPPPSRAAAPLPAPLSYLDVQELEQLALSLMQEMDKMPGERAGNTEQCAQCGKPLLRSQAAVKAMGRLYHVECFLCSVCHSQLQGQQFYEVDGKPLCETCHQETLEKCSVCKQPITERMLRATGRAFHPSCFTCSVCGRALEGQPFIVDPEGAVNCVDDYHRKFAPKCSVCHEPIIPEEGKDETVRIIALEKNFHVKCYRCEDCGVQLSTEADEGGCYPLDGHVLCLKCHTSRVNQGKRD